jgi:predicted  nucleic acid-binding Zn-ribbon protein
MRSIIFLLISSISALLFAIFLWLQQTDWQLDINPTTTQQEKALKFESKLERYDDIISDNEKILEDLRQQSERLENEDIELDKKIKQIDQELGLDSKKFKQVYPEFDSEGQSQ